MGAFFLIGAFGITGVWGDSKMLKRFTPCILSFPRPKKASKGMGRVTEHRRLPVGAASCVRRQPRDLRRLYGNPRVPGGDEGTLQRKMESARKRAPFYSAAVGLNCPAVFPIAYVNLQGF